jgi:hypothetical protein
VRRQLALFCAATVLAVAGCGDTRLTHEQLLDRADAVCATYNRATVKLAPPRTLRQIRRLAARVLPAYRTAIAKLDALRPPKEDENAFDAWLAADRRIQLDVEQLARAARRGDVHAVRAAAAQASADDARSSRLANALGLSICGTRRTG